MAGTRRERKPMPARLPNEERALSALLPEIKRAVRTQWSDYAKTIGRNTDATDIEQDTALVVLRKIRERGTALNEEKLKRQIPQIVRYLLLHALRSTYHRTSHTQIRGQNARSQIHFDAPGTSEMNMVNAAIMKALNGIKSAKTRQWLVRAYGLDGRWPVPIKEIALQAGMTGNAMSVELKRARKKLSQNQALRELMEK